VTTPCAWGKQLSQYLDGELSQNRAREVEEHLAGCSECQRQRQELAHILGALAPGPGEFDESSLADDVLRRVRSPDARAAEGRARPWWRQWFMLPGAAALAAAAAAVLVVTAPWSGQEGPPRERAPEFVARGKSHGASEQWLKIWVFRRSRSGQGYEEVGATIQPNDRLIFGYLNTRGNYQYLMIVAVDRDGHLYWYHPGYERASEDPQSIRIQPGRHELPVEIEHDLPEGGLRLFAIFTRRPLRVSEMEKLIGGLRAGKPHVTTMDRLPLADSGQVTRFLRVGRRQ
jgi:hypothetical protein